MAIVDSITSRTLAFPAVAVVLLLFGGGLAFAAVDSFGHYARALREPEFIPSLRLTLNVALASTLLSAAAGFGIAVAVTDAARRSNTMRTLLQIPIAAPHLTLAVAVILLAAPSGLVARLAFAAGLIAEPADVFLLVNDRFGAGIILVFLLKESFFLAAVCLPVLLRVQDDYHDLARTLGASRWQRLRYLVLPLVSPVLLAGSAVVFAFVFSAFEVPLLMGRPFPAMLGVVAQRKFTSAELTERPEAIALAMLTAAISAAAIGVCAWAWRRKAAA